MECACGGRERANCRSRRLSGRMARRARGFGVMVDEKDAGRNCCFARTW
jgi:hypothetical protein